MKKSFLLSAIILFISHSVYAKDVAVTFDKAIYHLAYVKETPAFAINEYIPKGSTLDNWEKMVALHIFHNQSMTPLQYARQFGEFIKRKNPQQGYQIIENPKTGEAVIDFLTWTEKDPLIMEFNIFKYKAGAVVGDIVAYQYAFRSYGNPTEKFQSEFKNDRERLRNLIATESYPDFISEKAFGQQ